jgi:hypothetical protein
MDMEAKPRFLFIFIDELIIAWGNGGRIFNRHYLDFSPFSRSFYVIDRDTSKQQRLSFPRKIGASLYTPAFSGTLVHE